MGIYSDTIYMFSVISETQDMVFVPCVGHKCGTMMFYFNLSSAVKICA